MMIPLRYNLRSLAVRRTTSLATAFGIALVVFVLAASLMLSEGIQRTLSASGREDMALIMRKGSDNEMSSALDDTQLSLVKALPGLKSEQGKPSAAGEVVVVAAMPKVGVDGVSNVTIRGVSETSISMRAEVKIVAGRLPKAGSDEVMIGKQIRGRFKGLELEQSFEMRKNRPVKVVGVFEASGSSYESEVWGDLDVIRQSFGRTSGISSIRVALSSAGQFDTFKASVEQDKRLGLQVVREPEYYEKLSEGTSLFIKIVGTMIAVFFSIGAMIGATITMYAAVANRQREIGTLRALGFSRTAILTSFVFESLVLSFAGGLLGTVASLAMGAVSFSMINFASWSEMVFHFQPTAAIIGRSLLFAGVMGFLGGFLPALRAARVSPIVAMRG